MKIQKGENAFYAAFYILFMLEELRWSYFLRYILIAIKFFIDIQVLTPKRKFLAPEPYYLATNPKFQADT